MSMKQAKEKILKDVERIRGQRESLQNRLQELQTAVRSNPEPVRGFNLEDIERASVAPVELISRIDAIKCALEKSFFDDPEFCQDALTYLQEIEPEVKRLDRKREEATDRIETLKRELELAEVAAEKARSEICDQLDDLFTPLGETIYSYSSGAYTGAYMLHKLRSMAEKCV